MLQIYSEGLHGSLWFLVNLSDSQRTTEHFLDAEKCARTVHDRACMANI
jgi:hypothetical protein